MLGTAEAEGEADGSAPQPRLFFQREDGSPLSFYVRPGAAKVELAPLILRHGGRLCRVQEPGAVLLARPGEVPPRASGVFISASYVADCVARQELLPLETYRLQPPPVTADAGGAEGRLPFSEAEDRAILLHLRRSKRGSSGRRAAGSGNAVWKEMEEARVTPHSWQAMRDRYLKHLRGKEDLCLPPQRRKLRSSSESAAASQSTEVKDVPQPEDQSHTVEGSKGDSESPSSTEYTFSEHVALETSEEEAPPNPKIRVLEFVSGGDSAGPPNQPPVAEQQPAAPSAVEVAMAVEDMKRFMKKFDVDLATVTQAFLKNSGEVAAVEYCLQMGQCLGGCPPWSRQDDVDLLKGDDNLRSKLVAKYGAENVNRRVAFRKS
ncbi:telomeric repeat-binding factor 2-interacting protein 1 isoform X2 [Zootoca vivipara]|uniref:telomeric repeat-binding factor 2-interacting protein 1 isoform X2 n=1 Tax=Zootoca vivipara TaxID=8524 RepID=UPI001591367C|nr:telomeric repeat-binding factor 2-interacting protein 1 isoform X2 [Zootoca vivipara]